MIRTITLSLDEFGRSAVELFAKRTGRDPSEFVRRALLHYLGEGESGRAAVAFPKLGRPARFASPPDTAVAVDLSVHLEGDEWEALDTHAKREGVALPALVAHTVMLYIADLDSVGDRRGEDP